MKIRHIAVLVLLALFACNGQNDKKSTNSQPSKEVGSGVFDLYDIQQNGELICLMLYGPESYFEFKGEEFGVQYMLVNEYAKSIGCRIRVDVSRSPREMIEKIMRGEGDIIATHVSVVDSLQGKLSFCGQKEIDSFMDSLSVVRKDTSLKTDGHSAWAVRKDAPILRESLNEWIATNHSRFFDYTTIRIKGSGGRTYTPRRNVKSPILNLAKGQISTFDAFFKQYSRHCRWDWRLLRLRLIRSLASIQMLFPGQEPWDSCSSCRLRRVA